MEFLVSALEAKAGLAGGVMSSTYKLLQWGKQFKGAASI